MSNMNKEEIEEYVNLAKELGKEAIEFSDELFEFVRKKPYTVGMGAMSYLLAEQTIDKNTLLRTISGLCDLHEIMRGKK